MTPAHCSRSSAAAADVVNDARAVPSRLLTARLRRTFELFIVGDSVV
jgi:hypothetical protein